jgi:hypothetical protein
MIKTVTGKLGNMRKPDSWVVYPVSPDAPDMRIIQCDKRIARIDLNTGKALLSDGKGTYQTVLKLSPQLGAVIVDCPQDMLAELKAYTQGVSVKVLG